MSTKYATELYEIYYDKKEHTIDQVMDYITTHEPTSENIENKHCQWVENGIQVCTMFGISYNQFIAQRTINVEQKTHNT
jgi:hypothetical protein